MKYINCNIVYYILIGTETILNACKEQNVQHLIYCSSLSVYYGPEEVIRGTETSVKPPSKLYFKAYASTKVAAQKMVLDSDGFLLNNGLYYSWNDNVIIRNSYLLFDAVHPIVTTSSSVEKINHTLV